MIMPFLYVHFLFMPASSRKNWGAEQGFDVCHVLFFIIVALQ
jgi:hypothetical protein